MGLPDLSIWMVFHALGIKPRHLSRTYKAGPFSLITVGPFPPPKPPETSCVPLTPTVPWSLLMSQLILPPSSSLIHLLREVLGLPQIDLQPCHKVSSCQKCSVLSNIRQPTVMLVSVVCFFHYKFCEGSKPIPFCSPVNPQHWAHCPAWSMFC